jgi:hypothetical protein
MNNNSFLTLLLLVFSIFILSCKSKLNETIKVDGLWIVKKVKVGESEMKP